MLCKHYGAGGSNLKFIKKKVLKGSIKGSVYVYKKCTSP